MKDTQLLYMDNSYLFEIDSYVKSIGSDDKGKYFVLNETIIYPQGGGQPSDHAICKIDDQTISVKFARIVDLEARNYHESELCISVGSKISIKIDQERRKLNSRYHTAGHLIGDILLKQYGIHAVKGHQFPNESYIKTNIQTDLTKEHLEDLLNEYISKNIAVSTESITRDAYNDEFGEVPYFIPEDKIFRICKIEGFTPVPCGGTHIQNISEIGKIMITKISNKDGQSSIFYSL